MTDQSFPRNPYVTGAPLTGEAGFYGRRTIFAAIDDTLAAEQQNVIVLYGQRRVGNTPIRRGTFVAPGWRRQDCKERQEQ